MSSKQKAEIGTGVAAAVAAAALGAYLLYGKNGTKNRKAVKGWMLKAKGEILEQMENAQTITESGYQDIVNKVISNYRGAKNVSAAELMALAADARKHWKTLKPMFKSNKGASRSGAKRSSGAKRPAARKSTGTKRKTGSKAASSQS
jgi:hypothetical protein